MANDQRGDTLKKKRLWAATLTTGAILATGLVAATSANASPSPPELFVFGCSLAPDAKIDITGFGPSVTKVSWTEITDSINIKNTCNVQLRVETVAGGVSTLVDDMIAYETISTGSLGNAVTQLRLTFLDTGGNPVSGGVTTITMEYSGGGTPPPPPPPPPPPSPSGGTSSGAAASAPIEVSLALDLAASGASCTEGSVETGAIGAWLTLPGAQDCSSTTNPDAKLLGWATTVDFPVAIAQRQIDNGWGAYELFDDEGRWAAVFIPAGGAILVSASDTLHPIWAN